MYDDRIRPSYHDLDEGRLERIARKIHEGVYGNVELRQDTLFYTQNQNGYVNNIEVNLGRGGGKELMAIYNNAYYYQSSGSYNDWVTTNSTTTTLNYIPPKPAAPAKKETVLDWLDKQTEEVCKLARAA
jgi:hypothetical protein